MARIVFIGAGSFVFTTSLTRDILSFPGLRDATLVLMDINRERLDIIRQMVQRIVERGKYPAKVVATMDRREALKGADAVLCTILSGDVDIWRHDIEIPKKYGINTCVGDTRGPSGIFRGLRTIPVMLGICADMEKLCPQAILLNYTNPMSILCHAMQRKTFIRVSGLCHSVQGTARMLANWIQPWKGWKHMLATWKQVSMADITYVCAGINHLAWFIEFKKNGKDAYPLVREAIKRKKIFKQSPVRNEIFRHFGYYVSESSGHVSEYVSWFRSHPETIRKYFATPDGGYGCILEEYLKRKQKRHWQAMLAKMKAGIETMPLERGLEYAASIINAVVAGGEPFQFNGNVPNTGIVTNLPQGACVEVPVLANRRGFNPLYVGPLPPACALVTHLSASIEQMVVEASFTGNTQMLVQAIAHDPLTAATLSLEQTSRMVHEMLVKNRDFLPQFRKIIK